MNHPKGTLIAIGGAEDKGADEEKGTRNGLNFFEEGILKKVVEIAEKKEKPRIEVITTASSIPDELARIYRKAFKKLGFEEIGHLKISTREEAENKKLLERLYQCNCVLFTGGDQLRLCSILGGTSVTTLLKERYQDEHFIIAGTSAGAAAMSNTMICSGAAEKAYLKGEVELNLGFGFLQGVIIDTHFDARGRFGRLVQAIATQPGAVGIGLGEDTGVIIEKGILLKAIGSSSVVVIDGSHIRYNNIADIKDGMPVSVANLSVHIMSNSDVYNIKTHEYFGAKFPLHQK